MRVQASLRTAVATVVNRRLRTSRGRIRLCGRDLAPRLPPTAPTRGRGAERLGALSATRSHTTFVGPMNPDSRRFTTPRLRGVNLHALFWGDASLPPLVLLHGGGANAHWWDHVAPRLATRFHVVALDFRGHGDSDHPEDHFPGAFNCDLEALLEHLGETSVSLLGHSMGGGVALSHAASAVGAVIRGLVVVDVARGASSRSRRAARLALLMRRTYASREEAIARYRFLPTSEHAREELRLSIAGHTVREEPDGRFGFKFDPRWFSIPSRPPPRLADIRCPTLILRGSESTMLSAPGAQALAAELPRATCEVVEGAGHHVPLDRPASFLAAVERFFDPLLDAPCREGPR